MRSAFLWVPSIGTIESEASPETDFYTLAVITC
jgi:hypothetical protein